MRARFTIEQMVSKHDDLRGESGNVYCAIECLRKTRIGKTTFQVKGKMSSAAPPSRQAREKPWENRAKEGRNHCPKGHCGAKDRGRKREVVNSVRRMSEAWVKRQFLCRIVADLSFHRYGSSIHAETHIVSGLVAGGSFLTKAVALPPS